MGVKIRLARHGRKKKPFYHIVVADARAPRDGRFIEKIGTYNPLTVPATVTLDRDKAVEWLGKGALPTDTVRSILRFQGVLYKVHLLKGVKKGAISEEKAERLYADFIQEKEEKIRKRIQKSANDKKAYWEKLSGTAKPIEVEEPVEEAAQEEASEVAQDAGEPVAENTTEVEAKSEEEE